MDENRKITGKGKKNLFKPGECPNPNGRPVGQRNYATIFREALIKLASKEGITPEEYENDLIANGAKLAKKDYRFYKDMLDRIHGTPVNRTDLTTNGKELPQPILNINSNSELQNGEQENS